MAPTSWNASVGLERKKQRAIRCVPDVHGGIFAQRRHKNAVRVLLGVSHVAGKVSLRNAETGTKTSRPADFWEPELVVVH